MLEKIKSITIFLQGKKTYIVGILMIALGLMQGDNTMVLNGLGFLTIRQAISTK